MKVSPPLQLTPAQLRALGSVVRAEIVSSLSNGEAKSVRDLAGELGRPVTGLYHHLGKLQRERLVRAVSARPGPRRPEQLYGLAATRLSSRVASRSKAGRAALEAAGRRFIAAATRAFSAALRSGAAHTEGAHRDTSLRHVQLQLSKGDLARLNAELDALLARFEGEAPRKGQIIQLTIVAAPTRRTAR
jgi:predicted ArsR family transcriptional regulator